MKRNFELELYIGSDGNIVHNDCIDHCLPYAFGTCTEGHNNRCTNCLQFYYFFDKLYSVFPFEEYEFLEDQQKRLCYYLAHQIRKVYLNAQFNANLLELDSEGALLVVDYKMRILPKTARETKQEFFGKKGWTLHTVLMYTKPENESELTITAFDHWSADTTQDAWFTASSLHSVIESLSAKPKWIVIISDNGPHYHNSEMMAIIAQWKDWYDITVRKWIFLEAGEAKTTIDSHHASVSKILIYY